MALLLDNNGPLGASILSHLDEYYPQKEQDMSRPHEHCSDALCNHKANGEGGMGHSLRESHQKDRMGSFSFHGTPKPDERLSGIKSESGSVGSRK